MSARLQLPLALITQILALCCWLNTAATLPAIAAEYGLDTGAGSGLTAAVQAGFALGALGLALFRAPDRVPPAVLISVGAAATAILTVLPVVVDLGFAGFLVTKTLVGCALAAVYTTGMRVVLSWAPARNRSLAVAALVSALTLGSAAPHLLAGSTVLQDWRGLVTLTAAFAAVAAVLGLFSRTGPQVSGIRPLALVDAVRVLNNRVQRKITWAYVGHMWEVYGMWVWVPALLLTLPAVSALDPAERVATAGGLTFLIVGAAGTLGCLVGGYLPRFSSKRRFARITVAVSAVCVLLTPALGVVPLWAAVGILMLWGAATIGDSALYSAMTGDQSGNAAVGTAIALQMGIGYCASIGAIYTVPLLAAHTGWSWAFLVLLIGPILSFIALEPWDRPPGAVRLAG